MKSYIIATILVFSLCSLSFAAPNYASFFAEVPDASTGYAENGIYPAGKNLGIGFYSLTNSGVLQELSSKGVNFIGPYYGTYSPVSTAAQYGVKCPFKVGFDSAAELTGKTNSEITSQITAQVQAVTASPQIFAWYLVPEELVYYNPVHVNYLQVAYNAIKAADTSGRPVYIYNSGHNSASNLSVLAPYTDFLGMGTYTNYNCIKDQRVYAKWVMDQVNGGLASNPNGIPMAFLEMFENTGDGCSVLDPLDYSKVSSWVKHDTYLSLVGGAKVINIFSGAERAAFVTYYQYASSYMQVASELNQGLQLGRVFLFGQNKTDLSLSVTSGPATVTLSGGSNLPFSTATGGTAVVYSSLNKKELAYGKYRYLFVVNSSNSTVAANILGLPVEKLLCENIFTSATTVVSGGSMNGVSFAPLEVKAFRYAAIPDGCGDFGYNAADISGANGVPDCRINLYDVAGVASEWLKQGYMYETSQVIHKNFTDGSYTYGNTQKLVDAGFTFGSEITQTTNMTQLNSYLNHANYDQPTKNLFAVYNDPNWSGTGVAAYLTSYDPATNYPKVNYSFNNSVLDGSIDLTTAVGGRADSIYLRLKSGADVVGYVYLHKSGAQLNGDSGYSNPANFNIIKATDAGATYIYRQYAQGIKLSWTVRQDGTGGDLTATGSYSPYSWGGSALVKSASASFLVNKIPDALEIATTYGDQVIGIKELTLTKNVVAVSNAVVNDFTDGSYTYGVTQELADAGFTYNNGVFVTTSMAQLSSYQNHSNYDQPTKNFFAVYNDPNWAGTGVAAYMTAYDNAANYPSAYYPLKDSVLDGSIAMKVATAGRGDAIYLRLKSGSDTVGWVYLHHKGAQLNGETGYSDPSLLNIITGANAGTTYIYRQYAQDLTISWHVDPNGNGGIFTATGSYNPYSWGGSAVVKSASAAFLVNKIPDTFEIYLGYINEVVGIKQLAVTKNAVVKKGINYVFTDGSYPYGKTQALTDAGFTYNSAVTPTANMTELGSYQNHSYYDKPTKNLFAVYNDLNWSGTGVAAFLTSDDSNSLLPYPSAYYLFGKEVTQGTVSMSVAAAGRADAVYIKLKDGGIPLASIYLHEDGAQLNGDDGYYDYTKLNIINVDDTLSSYVYKAYAQGLSFTWTVDPDGRNGQFSVTGSYDGYAWGGNVVQKTATAAFTAVGVPDRVEFHLGYTDQVIGIKNISFDYAQTLSSPQCTLALDGDISGPQGVADCAVDIYDLNAIVGVWLMSAN